MKALETASLIETRGAGGARGKGLYHPTAEGRAALAAWLAAPVTDIGEAMLRFAFLPEDNVDAILAFLTDFEAIAQAQVAALEAFLASEAAEPMTRKSRMAVEHGRRGFQASADWAAWASERYGRADG